MNNIILTAKTVPKPDYRQVLYKLFLHLNKQIAVFLMNNLQ